MSNVDVSCGSGLFISSRDARAYHKLAWCFHASFFDRSTKSVKVRHT